MVSFFLLFSTIFLNPAGIISGLNLNNAIDVPVAGYGGTVMLQPVLTGLLNLYLKTSKHI
jgi:hypothetical protein